MSPLDIWDSINVCFVFATDGRESEGAKTVKDIHRITISKKKFFCFLFFVQTRRKICPIFFLLLLFFWSVYFLVGPISAHRRDPKTEDQKLTALYGMITY